jgi:hypothetical protein
MSDQVVAFTSELLQLSSQVYFRDPTNRTPIPPGWSLVVDGPRDFYQVDNTAGYSAGAYVNTSQTEIVISFTGTNEKHVADWSFGNVPGATSVFASPQILSAIHFVADVMAARPGVPIKLTCNPLTTRTIWE